VKRIPLTRGYETIVDDEDFHELSKHKWRALGKKKWTYATRSEGNNFVYMHWIIIGTHQKNPHVRLDHINGNTLDNRRCNLRIVNASQHSSNSAKKSNSKNQYKGVKRHHNKWQAGLRHGGQYIYAGSFKTEEEAARAYDTRAREVFGEYARTNFAY
jgi:hypothetical protein